MPPGEVVPPASFHWGGLLEHTAVSNDERDRNEAARATTMTMAGVQHNPTGPFPGREGKAYGHEEPPWGLLNLVPDRSHANMQLRDFMYFMILDQPLTNCVMVNKLFNPSRLHFSQL